MTALSRCPHCRAVLREDAQWCAQCYTALRPSAQELEPARPGPLPVDQAVSVRIEPKPLSPDAGTGRHGTRPNWPCLSCGSENSLDAPVCTACGSAFLSRLASEDASPAFPMLTRLPRAGRIAAALAATIVLLVLAAGLLWVIS